MNRDFNIPRSEVEHLIEEWCFSTRHRSILKMRYLDGMTFEEIAAECGMSDRQIKRIVKKEGAKVLRHVPLSHN